MTALTGDVVMRGSDQILALLAMLLIAHSHTLDTGIDKGMISCSREKGNGLVHAEKNDYGSIVSGEYPKFYSTSGQSGLWCQIHIRVCSTCKVRITMEKLSFAECPMDAHEPKPGPKGDWCRPGCDHIHLYEVDTPYDQITHRDYFAGNESDSYTSISGNIKIRHCVANTSLEDQKLFKLTFSVLDKKEEYQGIVYQYEFSGGEITSPNFPHGYALNGETFTYMIQNLDPYGLVRLTFEDWDIAEISTVKVYDGLSPNSPHVTLDPNKRPSILSKFNTLVVVLSTGEEDKECCFHAGFKAIYEFASEVDWENRPDVSCSEVHPLHGGGILSFSGSPTIEPQFFDCVWLIKQFHADNVADGVLLRLREVLLGDGWLQYGKMNSLEIRGGVTSQAPLLARYTAKNVTDMTTMFVPPPGLYIRLRGGFYSTDKLSFLFTAVTNVTEDGGECPGYFDFLCANLFCIDNELMCDGVDHCSDGSDEAPLADCAKSGRPIWNQHFKWSMPYVTASPEVSDQPFPDCDSRILCGYTCITLDQICDGYVDCPSRVDEDNCAYQMTTTLGFLNAATTSVPMTDSVLLLVLLVAIKACAFSLPYHSCIFDVFAR